ncbi:MAG: cysteine desulfurase [Planctomycetota bacterium]|jgi:cysteine desulfurase/selenocysteine lyase
MSASAPAAGTFDAARVRADFPALHQEVHGKPLVYLDNAASAQTPRAVIDAMDGFYEQDRSNIHRGVHALSQRATAAYEAAREKLARWINAPDPSQVILTRGTTEGINLVAQAWGRTNLGPGDAVLISALEHHSNIVPWQIVAEQTGATVRAIPVTDDGSLDLDAFAALLDDAVKLVAVGHVSNALGIVNPLATIIPAAHAKGIPVLVDGAQAMPHGRVDVQALDADFYAFSGHKMYGPTGVGALYGRKELLEAMPPWHGGGDMIKSVTLEKSLWAGLPHKFEAGTPAIAAGIGLGATVDYLESLDWTAVAAHEQDLLEYATAQLQTLPGLRLIGTAPGKVSVCSFVMECAHPHDIGTVVDQHGVAIRVGHHCAQPVMQRFGVPATARASFAFYNTRADVDALIVALREVVEIFG